MGKLRGVLALEEVRAAVSPLKQQWEEGVRWEGLALASRRCSEVSHLFLTQRLEGVGVAAPDLLRMAWAWRWGCRA